MYELRVMGSALRRYGTACERKGGDTSTYDNQEAENSCLQHHLLEAAVNTSA